MRYLAPLLLLGLVLLSPVEGLAQRAPEKAASNADLGGGIRLTDEARLHPFIQAALAYDNNPNLLPVDPVGDALLIVEGGGEIFVPSEVLEMRARLLIIDDRHRHGLLHLPGLEQHVAADIEELLARLGGALDGLEEAVARPARAAGAQPGAPGTPPGRAAIGSCWLALNYLQL